MRRGQNVPQCDARHLARLETLDLSNNHLSAAGIRAVALSEHLATLTTLNISGNAIGDRGAVVLARSSVLPNLRSLDVRNCDLTEQGMDLLRSRFGAALVAND